METNNLTTITDSLNQKGWNSHDLYYYKLEFLIQSNDKKRIADIVLFKGGIPLGVIEVKSGIVELKKSIEQVKGYAKALGVNFIFISNGNEIFQVFNDSEVLHRLFEFPSVDEIQKILKYL